MIRNKIFLLSSLLMMWTSISIAQQQLRTVDIKDLYVRDPYVYVNESTKEYYLYKATMLDNGTGSKKSGVEAYKSADLKTWTGPYTVYETPSDNWIKGAIWAPEMHEYKGRYYLFATLNSDIPWKKKEKGWPTYTFRGTQIFHSDSPLGPFEPFEAKPHTPMDEMALDGTLWVEDDVPYMVYCHEWVQVLDGTMKVVKLQPDLSQADGFTSAAF